MGLWGEHLMATGPGFGSDVAMLPIKQKGKAVKCISILLVEDHAMVREGVRLMLEMEGDFEVVGEAQDGREAVAKVKKFRPAVVVMDIAMPLLNGLEATRQILLVEPDTRILILSAHGDDAYADKAAEFGAKGFILKQSNMHVLSEGIRKISQGRDFYSPVMARRLASRRQKKQERAGRGRPGHGQLTSREMEVLQLIAEGKANKQIAGELRIGIKTVEKHREHLMDKLGIHDIAGLTRYAICEGIIEVSTQSTISYAGAM